MARRRSGQAGRNWKQEQPCPGARGTGDAERLGEDRGCENTAVSGAVDSVEEQLVRFESTKGKGRAERDTGAECLGGMVAASQP